MHFILIQGVRTIREGALIDEGALTEVVRYIFSSFLLSERWFETLDNT